MVGIIHQVFESNDLRSTDKKKGITPHATIAKSSQSWRRIKIPKESYSDFFNYSFGTETVKNIELLSMTKPKQDNGYYFCFAESQFSS